MTLGADDSVVLAALSPDTSLQTCRQQIGALLEANGVDEAAFDARLLLEAATGLDRAGVLRRSEQPIGVEALELLRSYARRRLAREPVTRILGRRGFWSVDLLVRPDVLDPRPDSEALIESAVTLMAARREQPLRVVDLGTGSGALLCALLAEFANARGTGVDCAPAACRAAHANLVHCGLDGRGAIVIGDFSVAAAHAPFDLVVANPPYIRRGDLAHLDPEVRDYDPVLALDGGTDGLDAYRALAALLPELLAPDGLAIVEIGFDQEPDVTALFTAEGLRLVDSRRDLAGHPRALAFAL